jgi:hypothetical protein
VTSVKNSKIERIEELGPDQCRQKRFSVCKTFTHYFMILDE